MDTAAAFGFRELFHHVIGEMAKAVSERNGETKQRQLARCEAAAHMIMGFLPRDVIEAVLAGHCVMFHEVMTDSVRDTLRGELDTMRRATRANIVALDKAFGNNLARLERYQNRPAEGRRDAPEMARTEAADAAETPLAARPETVNAAETALAARPEGTPTAAGTPLAARTEAGTPLAARTEAAAEPLAPETEIAAVAETPAAAAPVRAAAGSASGASGPPVAAAADETVEVPLRPVPDALPPHLREAVAGYRPSPETIAACLANPEAMAALEDGDPERFAIAMGIDMPSEACLLAARNPGSRFEREAAPAMAAATLGSRG